MVLFIPWKTLPCKEVIQGNILLELMLLSEKSLSEDWLSDNDNRWDEVL